MRAAIATTSSTAKVGAKTVAFLDLPLVKKAEKAMGKALAIQTYVNSKIEPAHATTN